MSAGTSPASALDWADRLAGALERGMNARKIALRDAGATAAQVERLTGPARDLLTDYKRFRTMEPTE